MSHKANPTTFLAALCVLLCVGAGEALPSTGAVPRAEDRDIPYDEPLVSDLSDGHLDGHTLADAALIASGVSGESEMARYRPRLRRVVAAAVEAVGDRGSAVRRGRRLLTELHRRVLRRYDLSTDRFTTLLDQGGYNCVSASLLYVMAAREAGLDAVVAETPLHVFVVLRAEGRQIDIEATSPAGFDVRRDLPGFRTFLLANKYATPEEIAQRGVDAFFNEFHNMTRPVSPENAIAFLYHNAGIRALQARDITTASRQLINAARVYPRLAYRTEDLRTTLAWAVREQYDAGNFVEAFRAARANMRLFPDRTTVRDRLVAVAARVIEEAAGRGDLVAAEQAEAETLAHLTDEEARRRFEAYTSPVLARAALLARDWPLARRNAARFRATSSDPLEAERFSAWVESRVTEGAGGEGGGYEFVAEMRAAIEGLPEGEASRDDASVIRAIGALAAQGRFEEALAVGRSHQAAMSTARGRGTRAAAQGLETLMKAVAGCHVNMLVSSRRWRDAVEVAERALARWPGDGELLALHRKTRAAMAQDPWQPGAWPAAIAPPGEPSPDPAPSSSGDAAGAAASSPGGESCSRSGRPSSR